MFNKITLINFIINNSIIDLFICIAAGHLIGKIKFKRFQLNGLIGTLLCAMVISQFGISISNDIKYFFFSIFIYGVGYTGGPQFFKSLHTTLIKDILLTIFITLISLITILLCCTYLHLSKGSAVGIVAGSLTQSGMLAAANFAISGLGLSATQSMLMTQDMTNGFAITYFLGLISAMFLCVYGVEFAFKRNIRTDAITKEFEDLTQQTTQVANLNNNPAVSQYTARVFRIRDTENQSIYQLESTLNNYITVEKVKRNNLLLPISPELKLMSGDLIVVSGQLEALIKLNKHIGEEIVCPAKDLEVEFVTREIVLNNKQLFPKSLTHLSLIKSLHLFRGTSLISILRNNKPLDVLDPETNLCPGDVIKLYGNITAIKQVAATCEDVKANSRTIDFMGIGLAIAIGLIIGTITLHIKGCPICLGAVGLLISGLISSWINTKNPRIAYIDNKTMHFIQDFVLNAFIAAVGLSAGSGAFHAIFNNGGNIVIAGLATSIIPTILSIYFGKFILKYKNISVFGGALSGGRSSGTAFSQILELSGNSIPITSYTISYILSTVFLTLLAPVIIHMA